jgi:hypothetical protein
MKSTMPNLLLASALAALCLPSVAQTQPSMRGEAASLETTEADRSPDSRERGEDNRGRLSAARPATAKHSQRTTNTAPQKSVDRATVRTVKTGTSRHAELKTGQLTTTHTSHLGTKPVALHPPNHSPGNAAQKQKQTEHDSAPPTANTPHLKKHNARMF